MNQTRLTMCVGKVAFESVELARAAARRRKQPRRAYRCRFCRLWHVGTSNKRPTKPAPQPEEIPAC